MTPIIYKVTTITIMILVPSKKKIVPTSFITLPKGHDFIFLGIYLSAFNTLINSQSSKRVLIKNITNKKIKIKYNTQLRTIHKIKSKGYFISSLRNILKTLGTIALLRVNYSLINLEQ